MKFCFLGSNGAFSVNHLVSNKQQQQQQQQHHQQQQRKQLAQKRPSTAPSVAKPPKQSKDSIKERQEDKEREKKKSSSSSRTSRSAKVEVPKSSYSAESLFTNQTGIAITMEPNLNQSSYANHVSVGECVGK